MKRTESISRSLARAKNTNGTAETSRVSEYPERPADKYRTQIPRKNWKSFIDEFTARHQKTPVDLKVLHTQQRSRLDVRGLPLREIIYEPRGYHEVILRLGWQTGQYLEHTVHDLKHVMWDEHGELHFEGQHGDVAILLVKEAEPS